MKEITIQVFTKKEADEIIKKYPKKDLRKVAIIDQLVPDTSTTMKLGKKVQSKIAMKANTVYYLEEYIVYPTKENVDYLGKPYPKIYWSGKAHKIFKEEHK